MRDAIFSVLAILALLVLLPVLLLRARDRVFGVPRARRQQLFRRQQQLQDSLVAYEQRLLNPRQKIVEEEMKAFLPEALLSLYRARDVILTREFEVQGVRKNRGAGNFHVEAFLPLNLADQEFTCALEEVGFGKGFCFAADGCGNFYWVPVSETRQTDAPVFFACHDPWGNERVADNLEEFLSWPRLARKKT